MQQDLFGAQREQQIWEATTTVAQEAAGRATRGRAILPFVTEPDADADAVTGGAGLPRVVEVFRAYRGDELVKKILELEQRDSEVVHVESFSRFLLAGLLPSRQPTPHSAALRHVGPWHRTQRPGRSWRGAAP